MVYGQSHLASVADFRLAARRALPRMVYDFIDGGGGQETTIANNRAALDDKRLLCSGPYDVDNRDQRVTLFGKTYSTPVIIGPTGLAGLAWPWAEALLSRVAGDIGIPYVMSMASTCSQEEVIAENGQTNWAQLYLMRDRTLSDRVVDKAEALGFEALEVTVDNPAIGVRLRDVRNGFSVPMKWTPRKMFSLAAHPGWSLRMARSGPPTLKLLSDILGDRRTDTLAEMFQDQIDSSVTWDDIAKLRDRWKKPLIVKGLLDARHVAKAVELGVDGVVISNHGGRQLDGAVATIDVLPDFVREARGRLTILIDSGFRTGSDVARALALGADAVQLGRAPLYALAAGGEPALRHCLNCIREELDMAQGMMGAAHIGDFRSDMVFGYPPSPATPGKPSDVARIAR